MGFRACLDVSENRRIPSAGNRCPDSPTRGLITIVVELSRLRETRGITSALITLAVLPVGKDEGCKMD